MITDGDGGGPSLAELAVQGVPVAAWCQACGHHRLLPVTELLRRLHGRTRVGAVARRLCCTACGGRRIETRPHYRGLGVVAGHR
ncbi:MAG: hypothetical protein QF578_02170 [Alphaproteobacteria bacterium]|jgi:Zn finger protein HypA/HybF involved in hydrogenase expression|nr:hypothetical protein [Alphaproteobacteria bacterium]MDP6563609.1 hypothetical protein [Alphaproteobacteria bacterium]MDP6815078.1 hypothetical protein [Alphaproteobacteria bacterium]